MFLIQTTPSVGFADSSPASGGARKSAVCTLPPPLAGEVIAERSEGVGS